MRFNALMRSDALVRRPAPAWKSARSIALCVIRAALLSAVAAQAPAFIRPAWAQESSSQLAPHCPLPIEVAATFLKAQCSRHVLTKPQTFFRYFSNETNRYGRYLTTDRITVNTNAIRSLAFNQAWGNKAERSLSVTLPAGTTVFQGVVAPQPPRSCYPGGGQQTFIENSKDPQIIWVEGPAMTRRPFSCP
jgi:hypothetical protein